MRTYDIDPTKTGWLSFDASIRTVVAYFMDGHKETMSLIQFATSPRKRRHIIRVDCYEEGEEITEE